MDEEGGEVTNVRGHCPVGCGETLILGDGGYITCGSPGCPEPTAVSDLLRVRPETGHIADFTGDDGFSLGHPLIERIRGDLFDCPLHAYLIAMVGPPVGAGRYRVTEVRGSSSSVPEWSFTEITESMETEN
jgi:hypothetical protein